MSLIIKNKNVITKLPFKNTKMSFSSLNLTFFQKKKKNKSFFCLSHNFYFSSYNLVAQKKIQMFKHLIDTELEKHTSFCEVQALENELTLHNDGYLLTEYVTESHNFSAVFLSWLKDSFATSGVEPRSVEFIDFLDTYKSYFLYMHYRTCNLTEVLRERPVLALLLLDSLTEIDLINLSLKQGNNPLNVFDILVQNITLDPSEYASFMYYPEIIHLTDTNQNMLSENVQVPLFVEKNNVDDLTLSFGLTKDFLLNSFGLLLIMILGGAIVLRDRLMKLLILLEILFLIIIIGFTLQQELIYMTTEPINMGILFIALAACEAVLGLSIIIIRTRVLTTYLTIQSTNFIKYTKNKLKIF